MFAWDQKKATLNYKKHGVTFAEASSIFIDADGLHFDDPKHSQNEAKYLRLAQSIEGRLLLVVYTIRISNGQETIRIISARQASKKERQTYLELKD